MDLCEHGAERNACDICDRDELIEQLKADAVNARNQSAVFDDIARRLEWVSDEIDRARTAELVDLRARVAAAIAECEVIERDHQMDVAHSHGHGMVDAAEAIRRELEGA